MSCIEILERFGDSILIVVPADPAIRDEKRFGETLALAAKAAEESSWAHKGRFSVLTVFPDVPDGGSGQTADLAKRAS